MVKWFKRDPDDSAKEQAPMPRWLSWLLFGFIAYLVIIGNISGSKAPESSVAVGPVREEAANPKDYPAIRRTFSLSNWQRAFDPNATEGLKVRDFTQGAGRQVACGDEATILLRGRDSRGDPFDPKHDETRPLTVQVGLKKSYPAVEQAVIGMRSGGERIVDAPPVLVYQQSESARDLSTLALEIRLEKLLPVIDPAAAPLLLATNRVPVKGEQNKGALCGDSIGVAISLWDERGEKSRKLKNTGLTIGARELAIGIDHALPGIMQGETRTLLLPPAYQAHHGNDSPFDGKTVRLVEVTRVK